MTERYNRKTNIGCIVCKKSIYRRPSEINLNNGRVFCSSVCNGISNRKETPCLVCGRPIIASLHKKTCSRSCSNTHRAGIKYKLYGPRKDIVKFQQGLKLRLLQVRGDKCERCNYKKYEILQVHHKDRNRNNNDLGNLELICPNCHYEEHFLEKSWLKKAIEK